MRRYRCRQLAACLLITLGLLILLLLLPLWVWSALLGGAMVAAGLILLRKS